MQTFDADGNNTSDTVTLGNEVTYDGTYHYQYDKEGNETLMYDTTTSTTWSYSYDDENQMTEAQETIGYTLVMEANYEYDAFGSQVEENVGTTTTEYVQDHWNPATAGATGLSGTNVVADVTAAGSLITGYVWGNEVDQLFGRYDTSLSSVPTAGAYYLFVDQNGSVRDVVNSSGVDKDSIKYDGFGAFVTQTNANYLGLYGYDSYHYDAATGNYDDNARDYDPVSQRWVTMDPDGIGGGTPNLYEYAGNDPTNGTDPSGLGDLPGVGDTLWYMVCNPVTTYMTVNDSVYGNIYNGAKGLVNGEAGAALGNKAVGIVENNTGRPFEGTLGQNLSVSKEIGLQLLGITPLAESIVGADAQSGQVIPTTERIQRGAGGVASFAGAAAGGASLVRAIAPTTSVIVTTRGIQVLKTPVPTFSNLPGSGLLAKAPVSTKAPPNPPEPPQAPPQAPKTSPSQPPNCIQPIGEAPKPVVTEYPVESTAPKPVVTEYPVESTAPKPVVTEYPVESTAPIRATTRSTLTDAASRANATVGAGRGPVHGTTVHSAFEAEVNALGNPNLTTEVSYLDGRVVPRGTRGSVRLDVVEGPLTAPTAIFDLKTGSATLTPARIIEIQGHIPGGARVPVIEIR